jgi:hypothetical protein
VKALRWVAAGPRLLVRCRDRLAEALLLYLTQPIEHRGAAPNTGSGSLEGILRRGDVLLTEGNTRAAQLVKRVTRSSWSHVSMYVGPLEDGHDPLCIVEADVAAGVRSIRLSELNALQVRVLRPIGLDCTDRTRLAEWVVSRVGSEYDLAHAWLLGRKNLLRLPLRPSLHPHATIVAHTATRFICCSLLTHAFALVGTPISPADRSSPTAAADHRSVLPDDFERASVFEVIGPTTTSFE